MIQLIEKDLMFRQKEKVGFGTVLQMALRLFGNYGTILKHNKIIYV